MQDPELPRIWHSLHFSLGCSPAGWGGGHTALPGADEKLPTNSSTFQYFSRLCASCQAWKVTAAGLQQPSLVWDSTAKRHLLPMSQALSSQYSPAASGLIWLCTYQICLHLYCGEAQLQGSEHHRQGLQGCGEKPKLFPHYVMSLRIFLCYIQLFSPCLTTTMSFLV